MTESVKSESASESEDEAPALRQCPISTDVSGATAVPSVKPIFIIPGTLPSGICTPAVFLVNMIDSGKFRSSMMQVGSVGVSGGGGGTYLSLPASGRLSPNSYQLPSSSSYATLTPLQPLPPISTVSERLGQSLTFGPSFAFIQNGASGGALNVQNCFKYDNKLGVNTSSSNVSATPLLVGTNGYPQIQGSGGYSFALYDPSILLQQQQCLKPEDKTSIDISFNNYGSRTMLSMDKASTSNSASDLVQVASPSDQSIGYNTSQLPGTSSPPRSVSDVNLADSTTPSNRQIDLPPDVEINTKELAQRIGNELKRYGIPQAVFAQKILCRSQGTLSDLLRNPKPWSKLKSGRETFARMWKWLQEPESDRLTTLKLLGKQTP